MKNTQLIAVMVVAALLSCVGQVNAVPVFFGPTPYLSQADIPAGFYAGGSPDFLDDFEDDANGDFRNGMLDGGIVASGGVFEVRGSGPFRDSVDVDAGGIDGSGTDGQTFVNLPNRPNSSNTVTFTFSGPAVTHVGGF